MKPKNTMVVKIPAQAARRLYHQGHKICTSQDGYTTQEQVQQPIDSVNDSFFNRDCIYGFVVPDNESELIRKFQKQGIINMIVASISGMACMNFLVAYNFFNNYWCLGGFLALSYVSIHFWVKIFESVKRDNNPYMKMMAKYGLSINEEED